MENDAFQMVCTLNFWYFYNKRVRGCRRFVLAATNENVLELSRILKEKYEGKFLFDRRYKEKGKRENKNDLNFWWETEKTTENIKIEGKNSIVFVDNIEQFTRGEVVNKELSELLDCEVKMVGFDDYNCKEKAFFNCMSGFLNGHTASIRIINKKTNQYNVSLTENFAYLLNDAYICTDEAKISKKIEQNLDAYKGEFEVVLENSEKRLEISTPKMLYLGEGQKVCRGALVAALKRLWAKELKYHRLEIADFEIGE